jgi:IMP cyclohydrolase
MYIGRIVAIGMTNEGNAAAMYRVSSRSFPNRQAVVNGKNVAIMPREGFEDDLKKNPYITYNCARFVGNYAVVTNGSQTDPITEKLATGMSPRDAITLSLLALDYEHDSLDTPRIVAVIDKTQPVGFLGIIRKDAVIVREFPLKKGVAYYLSTYEKNKPCKCNADEAFTALTAEEVTEHVISGGVFADFEKPVTACGVVVNGDDFDFAVKTV